MVLMVAVCGILAILVANFGFLDDLFIDLMAVGLALQS